jgi:hypothetical protein|uniref:hypothetical protein n=1 Tax=Halomonas sp. TaxID=1486246 RepID=UPI002636D298|nr:hypothetical protein [Halomonas sp.]
MYSILRISAAALAAIAFGVLMSRLQANLAHDPLLSFASYGRYAPEILGAIVGVGTWSLLGESR